MPDSRRDVMNLNALFDDLLTSGITLADPERIRKLRALNALHLAIMLSSPFLGLFYFHLGAVTLFYAAVVTGLLSACSLLLLRRTRSVPFHGNVLICMLWLLTFLVSWNTGGVTYEGVLNPTWMLKGSLVLFAVFMMGYLHGTIWISVAFVEIGLFVYLFRIRFQFPNLIPYEISALYHMATLFVGLMVTVLMAFLFERDKQEALAREKIKTRAFRESQRYLDEVLDRSPLPTFVIDRNQRVVQWNAACQALTGVSAGDVLGKAVWEGLCSENGRSPAEIILENPAAVEEQFAGRILSRSESGWYEMEAFLPRFPGKPAIVSVAPLVDEGGTVRGAIQTIQGTAVPEDPDSVRQSSPSHSPGKRPGMECAVPNSGVTELSLRLKQAELEAAEAKERLKSVREEHDLLVRNIATFIRGKEGTG